MHTLRDVVVRLLVVLVLLGLTAFCGFGFLASFEYPGITAWHVGYAALGLTFATGSALTLLPLLRTPHRK